MSTRLRYIPLGPATYVLDDPVAETGQAISGGTGTVTWYKMLPTSETLLGTQPVTWNTTLTRYESTIPDSAGAWARADGDFWRAEVLIDSTTPARRHRNKFQLRVRPSGLDG